MTVYVLFSCFDGRRYLGTFANPGAAESYARDAVGSELSWLSTPSGQTYGTVVSMINPVAVYVPERVIS